MMMVKLWRDAQFCGRIESVGGDDNMAIPNGDDACMTKGLGMCEYCKLPIKNKKLVDFRTSLTGYDGEPVYIRCTVSIVGGKNLCLSVDGGMKPPNIKTVEVSYCPMCGRKLGNKQFKDLEPEM